MTSSSGKLILAVNAGSSSLKLSVFAPNESYSPSSPSTAEPVTLFLTASIENIISPPALFTFKATAPDVSDKSLKNEKLQEVKDHESGFAYFVRFLEENTKFEKEQVRHVCHRVVHGGDYPGPVLISSESYHHIESLSDLAPLHNGRALTCIEACIKLLPNADSIAFFDSMFHSTLPDYVAKYAINQEIAGPKGLRKYGFHGLSYSFILRRVAAFLSKPISQTTLVVMHLGSGASVCAIRNGRSIDTSMGLTPLDGLLGSSRSGHVDPSLIFHYTNDASRISHNAAEAVDITQAEEILNKESGWKALAGTSDFKVIAERWERAKEGGGGKEEDGARLAFEMLVDRVLGYVGSYLLKLGGAQNVDALVFSGGIGERSVQLRDAVLEKCKCVGFGLDREKNSKAGDVEGVVVKIGEGTEGMKSLVCRTDEQLEMARECSLRDEGSFLQ